MDYPDLNLADLPVEAIDPDLCDVGEALPRHVYNVEDTVLDASTFYGLGHLTASITEAGGNYQPGIVQPSPDDAGRYLVVSGSRRCLACQEANVPFYARVLPAETHPDVILRVSVESNSTQRDRSAIQRMNEARELAPVIRARLKEKTKAGVKADSHETFFGVIADEFFPNRSAEYVRQLHAIVLLAAGDESSVLYVKATADGRSTGKLITEAGKHVKAIHRDEMTVGEAYKLLDAVKRPRKVSPKAEAKAEAKKQAEATAAVLTVTQQVEALSAALKDAFGDKESRARFLSSLTPDDYTRLAAVLPSVVPALEVIANAARVNAPKPKRRRRRSVKDSLAMLGAADEAPDAPARKEAEAEATASAAKAEVAKTKPKPKAARPAKRSPRRPSATA